MWTLKDWVKKYPEIKVLKPIQACPVPGWKRAGNCYSLEGKTIFKTRDFTVVKEKRWDWNYERVEISSDKMQYPLQQQRQKQSNYNTLVVHINW